jgi:hypothetical protein
MDGGTGIEQELAGFREILNMAVDWAMEHDVADVAVSAIQGAIQTEVYNKYTPKMYVRSLDTGGLQDPHNIDRKYDAVTKTLELQDVRNDPETMDWRWRKTADPDNTVADIVEKGGPYQYPLRPYPGPRPFHSVAERWLSQNKWFDRALQTSVTTNLRGWSI